MRKFLTMLLLVATTISSCTTTPEELPTPDISDPEAPATPVKVEMNFAPEVLDSTSRAVDESAIYDMNLYLFGVMDYHFYEEGTHLYMELMPGEYTLYAVANVGSSMSDLSEDEVKKFRPYSFEIETQERIVMSASQSITITKSSSSYKIPEIVLLRSAAKVSLNIDVDDSASSSISLISVAIESEASRCYLFDPDATPSTESSTYTDRSAIAVSDSKHYSETTYILENRQGVVSSITDQKDKSKENAPESATYIKIIASASGKVLEYRVYLGENNTSDFNVKRNTHYTVNITIMGEDELDNRITVYDTVYYGTANCIINTGTSVTFDIAPYFTSKELSYRYTGLSAGTSYIGIYYKVLWQDKEGLITGFERNNLYELTVNTSGEYGNAVIAILDRNFNTLWSFHIWCTAKPQDLVYMENALGRSYIAMDKNLGATSTSVGAHESYGLFYQWGRKDPFIGAISASPTQSGVLHQNNGVLYSGSDIELTFKDYCSATLSDYTIASATAMPMNLYYSTIHSNWYGVGDNYANFDPYLWGNPSIDDESPCKSVYDPSPAGYKVPSYDQLLVFSKSGVVDPGWDSDELLPSNHYIYQSYLLGWRLQYRGALSLSSQTTYYPACGLRSPDYYGGLRDVGTDGYYWSATPKSSSDGYCSQLSSSEIWITRGHNFSSGMSVRCVRE